MCVNVYRSHDTWKDTAAHVMTAVQFPRPVLSYSFLPPLTQQPLLLGKSSIRSPKQIKTIRVIPCMILSHSLSLWYGTVVLCFLLLNGLAVFVDGLKFSPHEEEHKKHWSQTINTNIRHYLVWQHSYTCSFHFRDLAKLNTQLDPDIFGSPVGY